MGLLAASPHVYRLREVFTVPAPPQMFQHMPLNAADSMVPSAFSSQAWLGNPEQSPAMTAVPLLPALTPKHLPFLSLGWLPDQVKTSAP